MSFYRKKPVVIEARQLDGADKAQADELAAWCGGEVGGIISLTAATRYEVFIKTLEGEMRVDPGDFIIKEPFPTSDRAFYPCKPDIFEQTYDLVDPTEGAP